MHSYPDTYIHWPKEVRDLYAAAVGSDSEDASNAVDGLLVLMRSPEVEHPRMAASQALLALMGEDFEEEFNAKVRLRVGDGSGLLVDLAYAAANPNSSPEARRGAEETLAYALRRLTTAAKS